MYINTLFKKIANIVVVISFSLFLAEDINAQELTSSQLDSLYTKFIQLKAPELLMSADNPADLTHEDRKCGFSIVNDVKANFNSFSIEQQNLLKTLLGRPSLSTFVESPSGFFRIHYDPSGTNRPNYSTGLTVDQNVAEVAEALDSVYRFEVEHLEFLAPPSDNGAGGDLKYDVYIQNQPSSIYGYTEWESKVGSVNWTSFMVIDNDYTGYYSSGLNGMKVTVAHEFHHGIQLGNYSVFNGTNPYRTSDTFFYELTSTSMEEFVYDDVNDYYAYMDSYFQNPEKSFPSQNGYNLAIWNLYIEERFNFSILKQQWELIPSINAILAINNTIQNNGSSFPSELNKFGIWTYYTSYRAIPGSYFEEATNYPVIRPINTLTFSPPSQLAEIDAQAVSNNFIKFNISSNSDTLYSIITNAIVNTLMNFQDSKFIFQYTLFSDSSSGQRKLTSNYSSTLNVSNLSFWSASEILNDLLVRSDSTMVPIVDVNESFVFPNPFKYSSQNPESYVNIILNLQNGDIVDFNVYASDLELVYSSEENVGPLKNNSLGIYWDGLDNNKRELASGVYIYVVKKGDEIIKGKVVIFNE